ncbi:hypothetical protein RPMA_04570 [Tardiphaga alba]|uniref:DUF1488 domain-containing protein n=1 Tax=Tardiphaga alba TaxID=340268 RepID=A0ABX8A3P5_9BRAD|nr:hypothetical protein [Tardiphaga alba]QUS38203.1 hypothetical protein RPMA_04570 [Tardiphaga alba]
MTAITVAGPIGPHQIDRAGNGRTMTFSQQQQFTVTPRDFTMPPHQAVAVIRQQIDATPGADFLDWDASNRIALIEATESAIARLRASLGDRFLIDANAPLQY